MAVRIIKEIITVEAWRFSEAAERLELLRGIDSAMEKLLSRMTAKKGVWDLVARTQGKKFRFTDYGIQS